MVYLHHNQISVLPDFQHITKICQTQSSLKRVENHVEELNHYCDNIILQQIHNLTSVEKHIGFGEKLCPHSKVSWKTM